MERLHKKCLIASSCMHLFLMLLVLLGSAFFVQTEKKKITDQPRLRVVPTRLIDGAMAGGGGNPKLAPSDDVQKGQTLTPPVAPPKPPEPKPQPPKQTKVTPKPPKPTPEKPPKDEPRETVKPNPNARTALEPLALKPVVRPEAQKRAEQAEAARKAAEKEAKEWAEANGKLAKQIGRTAESLQSGFAHGTKVEVWGTGGAAYADYALYVKSVYDDAWDEYNELSDDTSTAVVKVVIARDGHVISAYIERRASNSGLNRSVQRALNKVKVLRPFPEGAKDDQRTFIINFNYKQPAIG